MHLQYPIVRYRWRANSLLGPQPFAFPWIGLALGLEGLDSKLRWNTKIVQFISHFFPPRQHASGEGGEGKGLRRAGLGGGGGGLMHFLCIALLSIFMLLFSLAKDKRVIRRFVPVSKTKSILILISVEKQMLRLGIGAQWAYSHNWHSDIQTYIHTTHGRTDGRTKKSVEVGSRLIIFRFVNTE